MKKGNLVLQQKMSEEALENGASYGLQAFRTPVNKRIIRLKKKAFWIENLKKKKKAKKKIRKKLKKKTHGVGGRSNLKTKRENKKPSLHHFCSIFLPLKQNC